MTEEKVLGLIQLYEEQPVAPAPASSGGSQWRPRRQPVAPSSSSSAASGPFSFPSDPAVASSDTTRALGSVAACSACPAEEAPSGACSADCRCKLYIGNVPPRIPDDRIERSLAHFGTLAHFYVIRQRRQSVAMVTFKFSTGAQKCMLHDWSNEGWIVKYALNQESRRDPYYYKKIQQSLRWQRQLQCGGFVAGALPHRTCTARWG
jgi:hypothetical protein